MTVNTTTAKAQYNGNDVTTAFAVPFRFLDNTHLRVILTSALGVDTTQVLTTNYTVTGAGASSGTVTMLVAPPTGSRLTILRNMPFSQQIDLVDNDPLPAETLEAGLDARAMEAQQLNEGLSRSLTLAPTSVGVSTSLPTPASNNLIGWNLGATALQNYDSTSLGINLAYAAWRTDTFNGTGAQTDFVLAADAGVASNCDVTVAGVTQVADVNFSYTQSTRTIAFLTGAPPAGTGNVVVRYGQALPTGVGTVTAANITDSTATGRSVLTAATQAAARTAIGAADSTATVNLTGNQTITGTKTFSTQPVLPQDPVLGTAVATTSGTAIDLTGIPSWVRRITLMLDGVSVSGTSPLLLQLGTSGGIQNTGYTGGVSRGAGAGIAGGILSSGFQTEESTSGNASDARSGHAVFTLMDPVAGKWIASITVASPTGSIGFRLVGGAKTLSGTLDRIRLTTVNGTDTFDAGSVNIYYE